MQLIDAIFGIAGIASVVPGVGLLAMPKRMPNKSTRLRQWLFEEDLLALLNRYHRIEPPLYRHHRIFGAVVIAGAVILLGFLSKQNDHFMASAWSHLLGIRMAMMAAWALAILALIVGIYVFIRPSALKPFEAFANYWIEPFSTATIAVVTKPKGITSLTMLMPKRIGILLVVAGIGCLWRAVGA